MKKYGYEGFTASGIVMSQAAGLMALVLAVLLSVAFPVHIVLTEGIGHISDVTMLICIPSWLLLVLGTVGMGLINAYPVIWIGDDYLEISAFIFARVRIVWSDIVDVGAGRVPGGFVLVRARRITVFHRLYGWLYSRTLLPSFLIGPRIENHDELVREIRRRTQHSNWQRY